MDRYANTVGELIALLQMFPVQMPVAAWRGYSADVDGPVFHVQLNVEHETGVLLVEGTVQD